MLCNYVPGMWDTMPPIVFPFRRLAPGRRANAFLSPRVTNPHTGLYTDAIGLVDTGAAECAIPEWLALRLGHDLTAGVCRTTVQTASGNTTAWAHTAGFEVVNAAGARVLAVPTVRVRVLPDLPFVLLGVSGFLESYRLTMDYPK